MSVLRGNYIKPTKQGGGWKGYMYVRRLAPGNYSAIKRYAMAVKSKCSGKKGSVKAARACLISAVK